MPNFSRIVRVGFEIVVFWSGVRKMLNPAPRYPKLGTGPSPASPYFNVLTGTDHLARDVRASFYMDLSYVVEGHASACPQTVGVDVKCVALTLIKLCYEFLA